MKRQRSATTAAANSSSSSFSSLQIIGVLVVTLYLLTNAALWKTFQSTSGEGIGNTFGQYLRRSVVSLKNSSGIASINEGRENEATNAILPNDGGTESKGGGRVPVVLKAYLEPIYQSDWKIKPLPARNSTASVLKTQAYPNVNSCSKLTEQWPVDDPPTDADPFLPWLHDVFPTADGRFIQFVAQNRRRCQSGKDFTELKAFLQPNIALFQHVPLARVQVSDNEASSGGTGTQQTTRYRLSSHEEADSDGIETRFICRFQPSGEESFSRYNFNYDWHSKRKGYKYTFTEEGFDNHMIWSSQLLFQCPVPPSLVETVKSGSSVLNDYATLFVDLVPIRTPPRYGYPNQFMPPKYNKPYTFIAEEEWGHSHILPRIEDSGRWENIPICKPSLMTYVDSSSPLTPVAYASGAQSDAATSSPVTNKERHYSAPALAKEENNKRYELISCVWTSDSFHTRGERRHITDNNRRLREWLEFHLMVGFDHIFIYDNSGAQDDGSGSLKPVTDLFPDQVTRINWPSKVCNNRPGSGDNKGERSSQYAAESSCRLRFGVHSNWIGAFDIDEYIIPMGQYTSIKQVVAAAFKRGIKILNFKSMRAWPRRELLNDPSNPEVGANRTFLQTYNCDQEKPPRENTLPAEKQIYLSDYVLLHFVHYSTVTTVSVLSQEETQEAGLPWKDRYGESAMDFPDELTEATMLHSKSVVSTDTFSWEQKCAIESYAPLYRKLSKKETRGLDTPCKIGIPFPPGKDPGDGKGPVLTDSAGFTCNCFINEKVEETFVPKLEEALRNRGQPMAQLGQTAALS